MDQFEVEIKELNNHGIGIAFYNGKKVILPFTLPGELVKACIIYEKKDHIKAKLVQIIAPSKSRVTAPCPYFVKCGGCSLQHLSSDYYNHFKNYQLIMALANIGIKHDTAPIVIGPRTRRRANFKVKTAASSIELGFFAEGSHEVIDIADCLILRPEINNLLKPIKELITRLSTAIKEIYIALSDSGIDMQFISDNSPTIKDEEQLVQFASAHDLARIDFNVKGKFFPIIKRRAVLLDLGITKVELPERAFLQAAKESQQKITELILNFSKDAKSIIDLYAGCGTYSFPMSAYSKVDAIEGDEAMVNAIKAARKNLPVTAIKKDLFNSPLISKELNKYDLAVINPPRNGAENQIYQLANSSIKTILMVSCNVKTFARDAKILLDHGYKLETATAIDQFYYSSHLESFGAFKRFT